MGELGGIDKLLKYKLVYLGTPYTKFPGGHGQAHIAACNLAGRLILCGVRVFSPIVHSHLISIHASIDPLAAMFWMTANKPFMDLADCLVVAKLKTWESSEGLKEEIGEFTSRNKEIWYLNPRTLEVSSVSC